MRFLARSGIRDGTPEEIQELTALNFTAMTGLKHIEEEQKPISKRHKKQMRMLLQDNFPYLGGEGLVKKDGSASTRRRILWTTCWNKETKRKNG